MRAAVYRKYGGPEVVHVEDVPRPEAGRGELLVRVHATTVSSGDARVRALRVPAGFGLPARLALGYSAPRQKVLGTELAGVVEALGAGVSSFAVGDRVVAYPGASMGCHAEYRAVRATDPVARLPASIPFEQGAALSFGGATALKFLRDGARTRPGERVLVIGAAGAVGSAAVQLAKHLGAVVTGVTSTGNVDRVRALGADRVVDYTREPALGAGEPYDVIFEAVGGVAYPECRGSLARGGRLVLCAGSLPQIFGSLFAAIRTSHRVLAGSPSARPEDLATLVALVESGKFVPSIDRTYPLARIAEAHAHVDTGHKRGSVVITVG